MEGQDVRDDWSRTSSPLLTADLVAAFATVYCLVSVLNLVLGLVYALCLRLVERPQWRVLGFLLMVFGLVVSAPQAFVRIREPTKLPSADLPMHALFIIGDTTNHVGLGMIIFWDICREGVLLVYALDPVWKARSLQVCFKVGAAFMLGQVTVLLSTLTSMHCLESTASRSLVIRIFYIGQVSLIFGCIPTVAFGLLARGVSNLWAKLPQDLPQRLVHHLRYTQWGLYLLMLTCCICGALGLFVSFVPALLNIGGFVYIFVIMLGAGGAIAVLLLGELVLTFKQLWSKSKRAPPLSAHRLLKLLQGGVHFLTLGHHLPTIQIPVWERGLEHSTLRAFMEVALQNVEDSEAGSQAVKGITTAELCQRHVRPLTAGAQCSAWEALTAGRRIGTCADSHPSFREQYLNRPTVMVSHCWASPFMDVLQIMKRYDDNTNRAGAESSEGMRDIYSKMLEALTNSIQVPNRMLLALSPPQSPLLLTRSWCLYEIYIAWKVGAEVSCGFVPKAEQKVFRSLVEGDDLIDRMLAAVDAGRSQATVEADRAMILSLIQRAGMDNFNQFVRQKLAASLRLVALTTTPVAVCEEPEDDSDAYSSRRSVSQGTRSQFMRAPKDMLGSPEAADIIYLDDSFRV